MVLLLLDSSIDDQARIHFWALGLVAVRIRDLELHLRIRFAHIGGGQGRPILLRSFGCLWRTRIATGLRFILGLVRPEEDHHTGQHHQHVFVGGHNSDGLRCRGLDICATVRVQDRVLPGHYGRHAERHVRKAMRRIEDGALVVVPPVGNLGNNLGVVRLRIPGLVVQDVQVLHHIAHASARAGSPANATLSSGTFPSFPEHNGPVPDNHFQPQGSPGHLLPLDVGAFRLHHRGHATLQPGLLHQAYARPRCPDPNIDSALSRPLEPFILRRPLRFGIHHVGESRLRVLGAAVVVCVVVDEEPDESKVTHGSVEVIHPDVDQDPAVCRENEGYVERA
mmetsp:Transcript_688/g.2752  ORF Transcript_688/g.2752 Transcript_688/m.2752 type:complete len:337 (-) Transcript_688:934-1944(-)